MDAKDARELAWWRTEFASRVPNLPRPGSTLMGRQMRLQESRGREWVDYQQEP